MTKEEILRRLDECKNSDTESGHMIADELLLAYIADPEITQAYKSIRKWYA